MTIIREYEEKDKDVVKKIISDTVFEIFNQEIQNTDDFKDFKKHYAERDGVLYVAEKNGKVIGTVAIRRESENSARLRRMYLLKECRGKGIGGMLLKKAIEFCKSKNYKKIILSTYPQMKEAIEFYRRNGFTEYARGEDEAIFFEKSI